MGGRIAVIKSRRREAEGRALDLANDVLAWSDRLQSIAEQDIDDPFEELWKVVREMRDKVAR